MGRTKESKRAKEKYRGGKKKRVREKKKETRSGKRRTSKEKAQKSGNGKKLILNAERGTDFESERKKEKKD